MSINQLPKNLASIRINTNNDLADASALATQLLDKFSEGMDRATFELSKDVFVAVALYLSVNFGISAADMIPIMISDKARLQFRWCKVAFDITVIVIGIFLGGSFGIGTIIVGFITGPTIQFFRKNLERRNNV